MSVRIIPIGDPTDASVPGSEIVWGLSSAPKIAPGGSRAVLGGKFLWVGQEKLYVRGVTYGTFRPGIDGSAFPSPRVVEQDFSLMSANGVNAVRTYTAPPHWVLEIALKCNLRVLVGMQGERHYATTPFSMRKKWFARSESRLEAECGHAPIIQRFWAILLP